MKDRRQRTDGGRQRGAGRRITLLVVLALAGLTLRAADDLAALIADRAAVERVYHDHRLGTKPPFEVAMPAALLERLVRTDLHKEAVLRKNYGVEIAQAMVDAEVQRIDATTRAPEILAELKAALGGDPARFARTMARPIIVERTLRARFENDDALHAAQRKISRDLRAQWLAAPSTVRVESLKTPQAGAMRQVTWQLSPRPIEDVPKKPATAPAVPTTGSASSATYTVAATVQLAQTLRAPETPGALPDKFYFEDLEPELQNVLRAQLRHASDVSAVIETPSAFLVFRADALTPATLTVSQSSTPKRSYDEWLAAQPE